MSTVSDLLTSAEAAKLLGIPDVTLRSWRFRDVGPVWAKYGVAVMYRRADVEAWIASEGEARTA